MKLRNPVLSIFAVLAAGVSLAAQTPDPAPADASSTSVETADEIVHLPAFSVSSEKDTGYVGKSR